MKLTHDDVRARIRALTAAEREELEHALLRWHAETHTPIVSVVQTPNGPVEMSSEVWTLNLPDDGTAYTGPRCIRLRWSDEKEAPSLADLLDLTPPA